MGCCSGNYVVFTTALIGICTFDKLALILHCTTIHRYPMFSLRYSIRVLARNFKNMCLGLPAQHNLASQNEKYAYRYQNMMSHHGLTKHVPHR